VREDVGENTCGRTWERDVREGTRERIRVGEYVWERGAAAWGRLTNRPHVGG
jgi:hypothetical protein